MAIIAMGIDPAKNVFAMHGIEEFGDRALARPSVKRDALPGLIAKLPPLPTLYGGGCDARTDRAQLWPSDASIAPASPSSTQGVTTIGSTSTHCA